MAMKSLRNIGIFLKESNYLGNLRRFATLGSKPKGKKSKEDETTMARDPMDPPEPSDLVRTTVIGGNIYKDGEDPKILPDSEYPDWLWRVLDPLPTLSQLQRRNKDDLSLKDLKRLVRLDNIQRIRRNNAEMKEGKLPKARPRPPKKWI